MKTAGRLVFVSVFDLGIPITSEEATPLKGLLDAVAGFESSFGTANPSE